MPINIPKHLPNSPGKLAILLNDNSNFLYNEFSPYTNGQGGILGGILSDEQPFVYTTITEGQTGGLSQLPSVVQDVGDIVGINQDSINDVVRVSKFLASSWGGQFVATQLAIQRLAPFDETRIYNPLSPVLATAQAMTMGLGDAPVRHVQGGLLGVLNSVTSTVGINISGNASAPSSTVGDSALASPSAGQGTGLIRGTDANSALKNLQSKWASSNGSGGLGGIGGLISSIGNAFNSFFGNVQKSPGTYRADEQTMDLMYNSKTVYITPNFDNSYYSWLMPWYNDSNTGQGSNTNGYKLFPNPESILDDVDPNRFQYQKVSTKSSKKITTVSTTTGNQNYSVGYTPQTNGGTYGDSVYLTSPGTFTNSDMLINFADYVDKNQKYSSKLSDILNPTVQDLNINLQNIVNSIKGPRTAYNATSAVLSALLPTAMVNYDNINMVNVNNIGNKGQNTAEQEYQYGSPATSGQTIPKAIDETFKKVGGKSLRMATSFLSDGINLLDIVPSNGDTSNMPLVRATYNDWVTYSPYDDDLIAFYFYDVVNSNYIPFRAYGKRNIRRKYSILGRIKIYWKSRPIIFI